MNLDLAQLTAALDRSFVQQIQQSFSDTGYVIPVLTGALYVCIAAAVVLLIGLVVNWAIFRRKLVNIPRNWVLTKNRIRTLLEDVREARAKLDIGLLSQTSGTEYFPAVLHELHQDHIALRPSQLVSPDKHWIGWQVEAFFKSPHQTNKDRPDYYRFLSEIVGVTKSEGGEALVSITMPASLELSQKRAFLRIEPPPELIHGLRVWRIGFDEDGKVERNMENWGPAILEQRKQAKCMMLSNISAGGMRLEIDPNRHGVQCPPLQFGERFFVLLALFFPTEKVEKRFFLVAKVVSTYADQFSKRQIVGLQFLALGTRNSSQPRLLDWIGLKGGGVRDLETWVVRRDLEQRREEAGLQDEPPHEAPQTKGG
jgi:hypothetical protein